MAAARQVLDENMPYFGYGYIKDPASLVPHVGLMFWSFRVMVGLGVYFIAFFAVVLFLGWKNSWSGLTGFTGWQCGVSRLPISPVRQGGL